MDNIQTVETAMRKVKDIQGAKEKLKSLLKDVKGIEGIGIAVENDGVQSVIVNINRRSFNKYKNTIPLDIDGFKIETQIVAKAIFQHSHNRHFKHVFSKQL